MLPVFLALLAAERDCAIRLHTFLELTCPSGHRNVRSLLLRKRSVSLFLQIKSWQTTNLVIT
jgi:hypothetical protein